MAEWAKFGSHVTSFFKRSNSDIVAVLKPGSEMLASIQKNFHGMLRKRENDQRRIQITCFYDELALPVIGVVKRLPLLALAWY